MIMHLVVRDELLCSDHPNTLKRCCHLISDTPVRWFAGLERHLSHVHVQITSWGCPRIDREVAAIETAWSTVELTILDQHTPLRC
jgi:hypothetical protein